MRSLRSRLFVLWTLSLVASLAVGALLLGLYRQSSSAQIDRAEADVAQACTDIAERYAYYAAGWAGPAGNAARDAVADPAFRADLATVTHVALAAHPRVAGGIWQQESGELTDAPVPASIRDALASLIGEALTDERPAQAHLLDGAATVLLATCPLRGPIAGMAAYAELRVAAAPGQEQLQLGLAVLMSLALGMTALLSWLVVTWSRRIAAIEMALAGHEAGTLPLVPATGERELDRIVAALNTAGARLAEARRESDALATRVALSERLAALGRVAAGVAHEIRNPIAAMRLRAENALAGDDLRRRAALEAILGQIARLDRLLAELLAMTQNRDADAQATDVAALLQACAADHRGPAAASITVAAVEGRFSLDAELLRRALDALLQNAVRHTPAEGSITLRAEADAGILRISVADTGPGVPPALRASLFEPFVTGRADGTGLGLAIARELVQAQGGTLALAESEPAENNKTGACFVITLAAPPCR